MPKISKILIANRGEIAVRVIRACRELGIQSVAVFSDADRTSVHATLADEAVAIGPAPARESYLVADKILDAARSTGADAIHPGYGFLSENAEFARRCAEAGILFIGPPPEAIAAMGNKTTARAMVTRANVPVVPGDNGPEGRGFASAGDALQAARRVGMPVMLKAAAGGGGKGMRLVAEEAKFEAAYAAAQREAKAAFGDDTVYLERAILNPRHVEVQVFADMHGHVVHLYERDCSIQRRHQKVIEESPSPAVSDALRRRMGEVAVAATKSCGYVGAGTIEFLLAPSGDFYFLEMNTRLQVEHPITELVTGVDLVRLQIAVAEGEPLPFTQADIPRKGAALECRIYAEDAVKFLPSPGKISHLEVPSGPHVRDDSGVREGSDISVYYDPLISKLATWGETRQVAIERMRRALVEYRVGGIKTNLAFHKRVMMNEAFIRGEYDTGYIERHKAELCRADELEDATLLAALGAAIVHAEKADASATISAETAPVSAWATSVQWRRGQ